MTTTTSTSTPKPETETEIVPNITALGFNPSLPLYILWLRRGNRAPETKYFQFKGNLSAAIIRSRSYCERMGYRFCGTYLFLTDMDKEEEAYANGSYLVDRV